VVIPVLDGGRVFAEQMRALAGQKRTPLEIVVVDSGSRDESVDTALEYGARVIEIRKEDFDHGATRNLGIEHTHGEFVVLLTQDATPTSPEFIDSIVAPFEDPNVAGVYGRQLPRPDCDVVTARNLNGWLTGREDARRMRLPEDGLERLAPMERYQLCVFDSVCCALRRRCWEEIPYERTSFGEDVTWGREALSRGWTLAYEPTASVVHSHRRSILYEFERTRECHALLHRLFGVSTLPRARNIPAAWSGTLANDVSHAWRHAPRGVERWRQVARAAGLGLTSPIAQHLGMRDAMREQRDSLGARDTRS